MYQINIVQKCFRHLKHKLRSHLELLSAWQGCAGAGASNDAGDRCAVDNKRENHDR